MRAAHPGATAPGQRHPGGRSAHRRRRASAGAGGLRLRRRAVAGVPRLGRCHRRPRRRIPRRRGVRVRRRGGRRLCPVPGRGRHAGACRHRGAGPVHRCGRSAVRRRLAADPGRRPRPAGRCGVARRPPEPLPLTPDRTAGLKPLACRRPVRAGPCLWAALAGHSARPGLTLPPFAGYFDHSPVSPASVARGPALMAAALAALRGDGYRLAVLWTPAGNVPAGRPRGSPRRADALTGRAGRFLVARPATPRQIPPASAQMSTPPPSTVRMAPVAYSCSMRCR
jgi:hypothetical protein